MNWDRKRFELASDEIWELQQQKFVYNETLFLRNLFKSNFLLEKKLGFFPATDDNNNDDGVFFGEEIRNG